MYQVYKLRLTEKKWGKNLYFPFLFLFAGPYGLPSRLDDDVAFPTDIKLERPDDCTPEEDKDFKICVVCGERASGYYFGALVCLPCKVRLVFPAAFDMINVSNGYCWDC